MNQFQLTCVERCRSLLARTPGLDYRDFEELAGKKESYLKLRIADRRNCLIEVYVYLNEAGYMVNEKEWTAFERPDYPSDEALINAFIGGLQELLGA